MTALSLCSGTGALDLAIDAVSDARTTVYAEVDPHAAQLMAVRFPGVPNVGDITTVDWARFAAEHPNTELGYDARWTYTSASAVGAPHRRPRWLCYAVPGSGLCTEVPAPVPTVPADVRLLPTPKASDGPHGGPNQRDGAGNYYLPGIAVRLDENWWAPELENDYGPAVRRWERILGRPAPAPTAPDARGNLRISPAFVEWVMGYPTGWVTDLHLPRAQQIKLGGNGVVPLQGVHGYRALTGCTPSRLVAEQPPLFEAAA